MKFSFKSYFESRLIAIKKSSLSNTGLRRITNDWIATRYCSLADTIPPLFVNPKLRKLPLLDASQYLHHFIKSLLRSEIFKNGSSPYSVHFFSHSATFFSSNQDKFLLGITFLRKLTKSLWYLQGG